MVLTDPPAHRVCSADQFLFHLFPIRPYKQGCFLDAGKVRPHGGELLLRARTEIAGGDVSHGGARMQGVPSTPSHVGGLVNPEVDVCRVTEAEGLGDYVSPRVLGNKARGLGGFCTQKPRSQGSGGWRPETRCQWGQAEIDSRSQVPGLTLCPHMEAGTGGGGRGEGLSTLTASHLPKAPPPAPSHHAGGGL